LNSATVTEFRILNMKAVSVIALAQYATATPTCNSPLVLNDSQDGCEFESGKLRVTGCNGANDVVAMTGSVHKDVKDYFGMASCNESTDDSNFCEVDFSGDSPTFTVADPAKCDTMFPGSTAGTPCVKWTVTKTGAGVNEDGIFTSADVTADFSCYYELTATANTVSDVVVSKTTITGDAEHTGEFKYELSADNVAPNIGDTVTITVNPKSSLINYMVDSCKVTSGSDDYSLWDQDATYQEHQCSSFVDFGWTTSTWAKNAAMSFSYKSFRFDTSAATETQSVSCELTLSVTDPAGTPTCDAPAAPTPTPVIIVANPDLGA